MAVWIAKVHAATAFPGIQLAVLHTPWIAAPGNTRFLHALEYGVEFLVGHMKCIMVWLEGFGVVEIQRKLVVDSNRRKVAHGALIFETKNLGEETRRRFLVARRTIVWFNVIAIVAS